MHTSLGTANTVINGLLIIVGGLMFGLDKAIAQLGDKAPVVIEENDSLPSSGAFLIELPLAKGLEFDNVIIADADNLSNSKISDRIS